MSRTRTWTSKCKSVKLVSGDARSLLPRVADASIDLIFTDPPYGHNNNNGDLIHRWEAALGRPPCGQHPPLARPIAGDGHADANALVHLLFREAARILRCCCCCCCCCCCGGGGPDPQFARWSLWMDEHLRFKQMVVWDKGKIGMGWHYRRSYETILVAQKGKGKCAWFDDSHKVENIIRPGDYGIKKIIPRASQHPTQKPPELAQHFIRLHSQPGETVCDPFAGSGSTAVAALREGRRFVGFEIDREFFDTAVDHVKAA